jgi:putative addiction module killer protein
MYEIETVADFDNWLKSIRDGKTRMVIVKRIRSMSMGTLGETESLGNGLFEAKIHFGPGFRLYFVNKGARIIVLLCGGDKSTQERDIKKARSLLHLWIFCILMQKIPINGLLRTFGPMEPAWYAQ